MSVVERGLERDHLGGPPRAHEGAEGLDRSERTLHDGQPLRHGGVFFSRGSVTFLQRKAGNAAVTKLLRGTVERRPTPKAGAGAGAGPAPAEQAKGGGGGGEGGGVFALPGGVTGSVIVQRKSVSYAPPAPPKPPNPYSDPKFMKVSKGVDKAKKDLKAHPPAKAEAKKAQAAAKPPAQDKEGQAKAAKADTMAGAKKSGFDKGAFITALTAALSKNKPQNLEQADEFSKSGKADGLKNEVVGKVTDGKKAAASDMEAKAKEPPDPSVAKEKEVKPLEPEKPAKAQSPDFSKGMPSKAPAEQTNLQGGKNETEAKMKEADVSEKDLEKSNEPAMVSAVEAKKKGDEHSAKAPAEVRQKEAETLKSASSGASAKGKSQLAAMVSKKGAATGQVKSKKDEAKAKDEARRAEVTANVNKIFDKTTADTEKILTELDGKVSAEFDKGEAEAKKLFTQSHETAMRKYKADRYGGMLGGAKWLKDKLVGMPSEVNAFYETAKALYVSKMTELAHRLADLIDKELTRAKDRVQQGRDELKKYVTSLPKDLQKVGAEAAKAMEDKFSSLESDVENKGQSLQEDLASKYTEAMEAVNAEIEKMQAENKGLWDSIKDAVAGAIKTILALKDLFMSILAKAAVAFKKIVADPLRFIGNFLSAVKQGFMNFASNILEHLKKGLKSWLFGALAAGGIEIPETFDLKGIIKLVLSILGLTWGNIRPRIVKIIGEKAMKVLETTAEVFVILVKEGPAGLIKWLMDKLSDLKDMVMGQIKSFVIEKIVKAGISWVLGMLNPAGALIKIIQALIAVVQWIMEKGEALAGLINSIIDAVIDIADGGGGGVPAKIEQALSDAVPLVLSFLAGLLGLGGISEKIKSILEAVQKPVMKAVDKVIMAAVKGAKALIMKVSGAFRKKDATKGGGSDGEPMAFKFTMNGASHELSGQLGPNFATKMSSPDAGPVATKVSHLLALKAHRDAARNALDRLRKVEQPTAGQKGLIEQLERYLKGKEAQDKDLEAIATASASADAAGKGKNKQAAQAALAKLASLITAYGAKYETKDLKPKRQKRSKLMPGDEAQYKGAGSSNRSKDFGTLEAEHITPGSILSVVVRGASGQVLYYKKDESGKVDRKSPYFMETTLMLTKFMADIKTEVGDAGLESDAKLINRLKALAAGKQPMGTTPADSQLNSIVDSRVRLTKAARDKAIRDARAGTYMIGDMTGPELADALAARITDARIESVAAKQLAHAWELARAAQDASPKPVADQLADQGYVAGDKEWEVGDDVEFDII